MLVNSVGVNALSFLPIRDFDVISSFGKLNRLQ